MRIANLAGRLVLLNGERAIDVERASGGAFGPGPQQAFQRWPEFTAWARAQSMPAGEAYDPKRLGSPSPAPRQIFGIGLNYGDHAAESGLGTPDTEPPVFTKFASCLTGPDGEVVLPAGGNTDWEVELVAVIGVEARRVSAADAWSHVAGLTVGQDLSERRLQLAAPSPQFSLGKSFPGFAPVGPWLVTVDEFANPDDLELGCAINGESVQRGRTSDMLFSVPQLIAKLSAVLPLLPGDLIFTGTPAGVGMGRKPPRWLAPGDVLTSYVEGIGELRQHLVAELP